MPDHAPSHPDEPNGHEGGAFAFQFGFIIAVVQAVTLATRASATGDDISQTVSCIAASWAAPLRGPERRSCGQGWGGVDGWEEVRTQVERPRM